MVGAIVLLAILSLALFLVAGSFFNLWQRAENWKRQQLKVESEWDAQAVGKALEIEWGAPIRANILPKVINMKFERDELLRQKQSWTENSLTLEPMKPKMVPKSKPVNWKSFKSAAEKEAQEEA